MSLLYVGIEPIAKANIGRHGGSGLVPLTAQEDSGMQVQPTE